MKKSKERGKKPTKRDKSHYKRRKRFGGAECARQWGGRRSDHHILSPRAGAAPERQLSRWSACSKLSPPDNHHQKKKQSGLSYDFFYSIWRRCLARLTESALCAKLEAFVLLFESEKTDKDL